MKKSFLFSILIISSIVFTSCLNTRMLTLSDASYEISGEQLNFSISSEKDAFFKVYKFADGSKAFMVSDVSKTPNKINPEDLENAFFLNPEEAENFKTQLSQLITAVEKFDSKEGFLYTITLQKNQTFTVSSIKTGYKTYQFDTTNAITNTNGLITQEQKEEKNLVVKLQAQSKQIFKRSKIKINYSDIYNRQLSVEIEDVIALRDAL